MIRKDQLSFSSVFGGFAGALLPRRRAEREVTHGVALQLLIRV